MENKRGYWYLATPYSKRPPEVAYREALEASALFCRAGISNYSPIVATHPVSVIGTELTHQEWLDLDFPMVEQANGVVVVMYAGWAASKGVKMEIDHATKLGKPVLYMEPGEIPTAVDFDVCGQQPMADYVGADVTGPQPGDLDTDGNPEVVGEYGTVLGFTFIEDRPRGPLPSEAKARKDVPMATGLLDYFPDALAAVAHVSKVGNEQHNPGQPLHWSRDKSADHVDCLVRHVVERGKIDVDGERHSAKAAWRALALLQLEIEAARQG